MEALATHMLTKKKNMRLTNDISIDYNTTAMVDAVVADAKL